MVQRFSSSIAEFHNESENTEERGEVGGGGECEEMRTTEALLYLKEVKDAFRDEEEKYNKFLNLMKGFNQRFRVTNVMESVKEMFAGHNNLIMGFNRFLPKEYRIVLTAEKEVPSEKEFDRALSFVYEIKNHFQGNEHIYSSFLDALNMYGNENKRIPGIYEKVATLFRGHPDLINGYRKFLPAVHYEEWNSVMHTLKDKKRGHDADEEKTVVKRQKAQRKWFGTENRKRVNNDNDYRESGHVYYCDSNKQCLNDKQKSAQMVEDFGANTGSLSHNDEEALRCMPKEESIFFEEVKERLQNSNKYQEFLKFLHIYSIEIITREELLSLVADSLGKYDDLMDGFNDFLKRCEDSKSPGNNSQSSTFLKFKDKDKEQKGDVNTAKVKDKSKSNDKYMEKSSHELDLSDCKSGTPSYRRLREDYSISSAKRSDLSNEVLNDHWVSVSSGKEDYSFKQVQKNQYDEILFRCEDDRFELDIMLEHVRSTAMRVEDFLESIDENTTSLQCPIRIEDHFSALNLRCIERLYGDHGLDMLDMLGKNLSIGLPIILNRLKQKLEELTKLRLERNPVWAEVHTVNYYRSLDHCSSSFKQQD